MRIEKSWGYERIVHNGEYCCKLLVYTKPIASSLHYHVKKHETFYVADGLFDLQLGVEDEQRRMTMSPGTHVVLPPGTPHRVRCLKPGTIVEASTHDDPEDCVRLVPSES